MGLTWELHRAICRGAGGCTFPDGASSDVVGRLQEWLRRNNAVLTPDGVVSDDHPNTE